MRISVMGSAKGKRQTQAQGDDAEDLISHGTTRSYSTYAGILNDCEDLQTPTHFEIHDYLPCSLDHFRCIAEPASAEFCVLSEGGMSFFKELFINLKDVLCY